MTPAERILKLKAEKKKAWIANESFECPACGEKFRYEINYKKHIKSCSEAKYG